MRTRISVGILVSALLVGLLIGSIAPASAVEKRLRAAVRDLPVAAETHTGYDRDKFKHWIDADGDCQDTRDEVLAAESLVAVSGCDITRGKWFSYYDRRTWTSSSDVDIDHLVALSEAWDSGARRWNGNTRMRYANDLGDRRTLVAVTDNVNMSKSDSDPAQWLPQYGRCRYVREWVAVKIRWSLKVDTTEKHALMQLAGSCPNVLVRVARAKVVLATTGAASATSTVAHPVRFSRVWYDSPGTDTGTNASLNAEWARVTNYSTRRRALTGWTVRDPQGHRYKFPIFVLRPGASVKLHTGSGRNTATDVYWRQSGYVWNNTGDKAILRNRSGVLVDTCKWGDGIGYINC